MKANKPRELVTRRAPLVLAAAMMLLGGARAAWAHGDPATCNHPGVAIEFFTFRSDGVTPISGTDAVSPCETIVYQVRLTKQPDPTVCAFEAGKIFITTPDNVQHDVTPAGGVPCVGGTIAPCSAGVTEVSSQELSFTVNQPSGFLGAIANYGLPVNGICQANSFCGTAHTSDPDLGNILSQTTAAVAPVQRCPSPDPCVFACDPNKRDSFRQGLCVDDRSYIKNACDDGNPCTDDTCCPDCTILCPHTRICVCGRGKVDICRPAQGSCDIQENCDGTNDTCPADIVKPRGEPCGDRGSGNVCNGRDSDCPFNCGNGILEPELGETCDDGDSNGTPTDGCRRDCQLKCGDGDLDLLEQCDPAIRTEKNCTPSCRLECKSDSDCRRDNRCTRFLCENGLCATGMGCPGDPCTGASGRLDQVVCGFQRQLGGGNCATGPNQEVAKSVNRHVTRLARRLGTIPALCGKAQGRKTIQQLLKGAGRKLVELQLLAARNVDRLCFHELNGSATENDGRLDFLRLQVKGLRQDLRSGGVTCGQLKAGGQASHAS